MQTLWNDLYLLLGLGSEPRDLTFLQILLRGLVVFAVSILMVRCGDRRSLAQKSAFDLVFIIIIGSVLARAVNGSAPFFSTLGATFVCVIAHRALAHLVYHWPALGRAIKGSPIVLMRDGKYQRSAMRSVPVTDEDLAEDMRLDAKTEEKEEIKVARLEPSGDISFIKKAG